MKNSSIIFIVFWSTLLTINSCTEDFTEVQKNNLLKMNLSLTEVINDSANLQVQLKNFDAQTYRTTGICWSENENPTTNDNRKNITIQHDKYQVSCQNLNPNTTYYARFYAEYNGIYLYSNQVTIEIQNGVVQLTTNELTDKVLNTATSGGAIISDGGFQITHKGVCWSTKEDPTINDSVSVDGQGNAPFTSAIKNLKSSTKYYLRAYATNKTGTFYGNQITYTVPKLTPNVSLVNIYEMQYSTLTFFGNIDSDNGSKITSKGFCFSTQSDPDTSDQVLIASSDEIQFYSHAKNLPPSTMYYYRAFATNKFGISYSSQNMLSTTDGKPKPWVSNLSPSTSDETSFNITIVNSGFDPNPTDWGICYSKLPDESFSQQKNITTSGTKSVNISLQNLDQNAAYVFKVFASNSYGTTFSDYEHIITGPNVTGETGSLTDIDGNTYKWVGIGKQIWMAENLRATHYPDGTEITLISDDNTWVNTETDAFCYYNNDITQQPLYNFAAAKKACPTGWHLPTVYETSNLISFISSDGNTGKEGYVLKSTTGWLNNGNGNDKYGFNALPVGFRSDNNGYYSMLGQYTFFWTSTTYFYEELSIYSMLLYSSDQVSDKYAEEANDGFSIRCVKDGQP